MRFFTTHLRLQLGFFRLPCAVLCLLSSVFCSSSSAQPDAPKPAKLRFLFLDETAGIYSLKVGIVARPISANPYEISSPFTPADFKSFDVYKTLPDPVTGQPKPTKIAIVTPPTNTPSALVLISPRPASSPDEPPIYRVELIDTNPADFPPGSIRIVNRGQVAMGAQFGADRVITQPGETRVVRPVTDARYRVASKIAAQEPASWQLLSDSLMIVRPQSRIFGIFVYSPSGLSYTLTPGELAQFGQPPPGHFWLTFSDSP
jgi:hypothetical protein